MAFVGAWLLCLLFVSPSAYGQDAFFQSGVASWYGPWHHGKSTATGEAFDMFAMTAAHRTLPLGTLVRVEHKESGKSVIVRINDRTASIDPGDRTKWRVGFGLLRHVLDV